MTKQPLSILLRSNGMRLLTFLLLLLPIAHHGQDTSVKPYCTDKAFHKEVDGLLSHTVETIDVGLIKENPDAYLILDAREKEEFDVSHIPGAFWVGYNDFKITRVPQDKRPVVIYCSVGYRSEKVGEIVKRHGHNKVYNLYGSIFEWANRGFPLCDKSDNSTQTVHTYNKAWSKWVDQNHISVTW